MDFVHIPGIHWADSFKYVASRKARGARVDLSNEETVQEE